jgi:tetratricopeptide (TPR) repeat protein
MKETHQAGSAQQWTSTQAYVVAVICLLVGIAAGWLIRGSQTPAQTAPAAGLAPAETGASQAPLSARLKEMADAQAAPVIEQLKSEPNNADLLINLGNIYYDTQQYPTAIEYYQRALTKQPANAAVRTDMATAYWYLGNADEAITEFKKALSYEPNNANTLFNLGIVQWQGKMDVDGAVTTWQKLLDSNPNYAGKEKVRELMDQAKRHAGIKPGTPARPLPQ